MTDLAWHSVTFFAKGTARTVSIQAASRGEAQAKALELFASGGLRCARCDTGLTPAGTCNDLTCPFSDHLQSCEVGWVGHPEGVNEAICSCPAR